MRAEPFRPLAIGAPRSGFVLLCSILNRLAPLVATETTLRQCMLNRVIDAFGGHIADEIIRVIARAGLEPDLVYSPAFRTLTGGPKWLGCRPGSGSKPVACFRKYIGVRGLGDLTLITSHPPETLEYDDVVHSHVDPAIWLSEPRYARHRKFVSIRNPIGAITSALLSINALTSEYLQRFRPAEGDTSDLRERLALYKFTDLSFFDGVVGFYRHWFDAFLPVRDGYEVMRWEDLLTDPEATISRLGAAAGLPVDREHAAQIWQGLAFRNLTGAHRHNYREGGGVVGGWRRWITNRHLDRLRQAGFDEVLHSFGYDPVPRLDETAYTPFQRQVDEILARGAVFEDFGDRDVFGFAFNKSNIDASAFPFREYGWKSATRIERADFRDERLMEACWEAADAATRRVNAALCAVLEEDWTEESGAYAAMARVRDAISPHFEGRMPRAFEALFPTMGADVGIWCRSANQGIHVDPRKPPALIRAMGNTNLVSFRGRFFAIPQSAGPLDLASQPVDHIPGVLVRDRYPDLLALLHTDAAKHGEPHAEPNSGAETAGPARLTAAPDHRRRRTGHKPSLTIVTPSLNHGDLIGEALDSVAVGVGDSVQHVVVDGGSTDGTHVALTDRALDVEILPGSTSHQALNLGVRLARGDIVGFLNTDDRYEPGALDLILDVFRTNPAVDVVCGAMRFFRIDPDGSEVEMTRRRHLKGPAMLLELTFGAPGFNSWFFRRSLLERVGEFDPIWDFAADRDFLLRLLRVTTPLVIDPLVYHYRFHDRSRTMNPAGRNRVAISIEHMALARLHRQHWPDARDLLTAWWGAEWVKLKLLGGSSGRVGCRPPLSALPMAWRFRRQLKRMSV